MLYKIGFYFCKRYFKHYKELKEEKLSSLISLKLTTQKESIFDQQHFPIDKVNCSLYTNSRLNLQSSHGSISTHSSAPFKAMSTSKLSFLKHFNTNSYLSFED